MLEALVVADKAPNSGFEVSRMACWYSRVQRSPRVESRDEK